MRKTAFLVLNVVGLLALAAPAAAEKPKDDDIGTRPAGAPVMVEGALQGDTNQQQVQRQQIVPDRAQDACGTPDCRAQNPQPVDRDLVVAEDPPKNWYVLDAGLRTHRDTFIGVATLSAAQSRTERFYGAASLALIRNDAGSHFGVPDHEKCAEPPWSMGQ